MRRPMIVVIALLLIVAMGLILAAVREIRRQQEMAAEYDRRCALIHAIERNEFQEAKRLIESGADVNQQDRHGKTPLHAAIDMREGDLFMLLLEHKARLDLHDRNGTSIVHRAAMEPNPFWLHEVLKNGGNPNEINVGNRVSPNTTPIQYALNYGNTSTVIELIDAGADVNHMDDKGRLPFSIAIGKKMFRAAIALVKAGADPGARWGVNKTQRPIVELWRSNSGGNNGKSALDPEDQAAYAELVQLLKEKGYLKEDVE